MSAPSRLATVQPTTLQYQSGAPIWRSQVQNAASTSTVPTTDQNFSFPQDATLSGRASPIEGLARVSPLPCSYCLSITDSRTAVQPSDAKFGQLQAS